MNVIRSLFCFYQAAPQNDLPLETLSSVSGMTGHHDDRSNPFNEAPILADCRGGNLAWVRELLESDPHLVNQTALSGKTGNKVYPLYIAAGVGDINVVKHLVAVFIETLQTLPEADRATLIRAMLTAARKCGATSVFIAAQNGHGEVVNWLLEHGADPKKKWVMYFPGKYRVCKPFFTKTPLQVAIQEKYIFIAARLNMAIRERKAGI